jgi:hypothetical protein
VVVRFGRSVPNGFIAVYRVETEAEAKALLVLACSTNLDNEFVARELVEKQTLDNLDAFGARLEQTHKAMR